ncbi:MAG: histidine phosphatase family protein, partial [Betaproteobacteria bacterium]
MDLILWRHAEANEIEHDDDDLSRVLTVRGEKQAQRMSNWLDRQLPDTVKIWSSPSVRAEQTVLALGRKYKVR